MSFVIFTQRVTHEKNLSLLLLFFTFTCFSQSSSDKTPKLVFQKYGYIDGIRLDSIPSAYIEVTLQNNFIHVNYGQPWDGIRNARVYDSNKDFILIWHNTVGATLNFMDYNGWEFVNFHQALDTLLFKKKRTRPAE